jgi:hypothetical protein
MTYYELDNLVRGEISDLKGTATQRFVSETLMLSFANEAVREVCIRKRPLVDSATADLCTIAVTAGEAFYPVDPRVLLILRGRMTGETNPLGRVSFPVMDGCCPGWESHTGVPEAFITGMYKGIHLYPLPTAPGTLNLTVVRAPLVEMTDTDSVPEIPVDYHRTLISWIKHKVYAIQDVEVYDKGLSTLALAEFEKMVGPRSANLYDLFDSMQIPQYLPERASGMEIGCDYL